YVTPILELVLSRAPGEYPKYTLETARTIRAMTMSQHVRWATKAHGMIDNLLEIIDRKGSRADEENTKTTEIAILSLVNILFARLSNASVINTSFELVSRLVEEWLPITLILGAFSNAYTFLAFLI
ncbi:hypothetical protein PMAYCL1PPCAC_21171, partial [Pristionchus mayeri]